MKQPTPLHPCKECGILIKRGIRCPACSDMHREELRKTHSKILEKRRIAGS